MTTNPRTAPVSPILADPHRTLIQPCQHGNPRSCAIGLEIHVDNGTWTVTNKGCPGGTIYDYDTERDEWLPRSRLTKRT